MDTVANTKNILIVGVGGQGIILAGRIIGNAALKMGLNVKVSEIHGMAQRGGSVVTHVRFGRRVYSPTIEQGTADIILAFEKLEALRWMHYLRLGGTVIVNEQEIYPLPVLIGKGEYPSDVLEKIKRKDTHILALDAFQIAVEAGNPKAVNMVLVGALAAEMGFKKDLWHDVIKETVPKKSIEANIQAFNKGFEWVKNPRVCI
ncbi:MAG TPA: indolepyruvate oxidoreductase subunit beta [Peptococcaceae bacterium]|nr:MAG: Indolepyruvate ferredoxin oxidoreductase, beta subunit [Clostridia bacterium 41_269]HBT20904.1 indolepyruvate oxidoreductase subunit beta [Peptococcaceae bacterium]